MNIENGILMSISASDIKNGVLKLPKKVKEIANEVISNEIKLTKVVALGLEKIGNYNFYDCNGLTSFNAPILAQIGNYNFVLCKSLTSFNAPILAQIGNYNFVLCKSLTSFNAPILAQIGNDNFYDCNGLITFNAPILAQIGNYNFIWCNGLTIIKIKNKVLNVKNVDGYCFVIEKNKNFKDYKIYIGNNFNQNEEIYVAKKNGFTAHGKTLKKAIEDVNFKVVAEKLKKEPINEDTELTVMYYRTITGACEFGCKDFMDKNQIKEPIKAKDLLPILEINGAYGIEKFKSLITF